MADVFVSYSRRDSEFVRRLVEELQARGKEVWLDVEGIRDGEVFPAALRSAVEGSDGFVFVISPDSVASSFCRQEVDHALNGRLLATASLDHTIRIWDIRAGIELRAIRDPAPLTAVAFSPDSRRVASGDAAGTVRIWDACTGCLQPQALLALARRRVTRALTPLELSTFLGSSERRH